MRTHSINPYVVNNQTLLQKFKGYRLFKKKETVVPPKTAEELKEEADSIWHDKELFNILGERHSGTSRYFQHALLQSDGYYKCSYLLNDTLLTCYTTSKPEDNIDHKVVCGYMPYHSNNVYVIRENKIAVPLNDVRVLWHEFRMMDTSTLEGLAIYLKNHLKNEAWKKSPAGQQERKDRDLTDIL